MTKEGCGQPAKPTLPGFLTEQGVYQRGGIASPIPIHQRWSSLKRVSKGDYVLYKTLIETGLPTFGIEVESDTDVINNIAKAFDNQLSTKSEDVNNFSLYLDVPMYLREIYMIVDSENPDGTALKDLFTGINYNPTTKKIQGGFIDDLYLWTGHSVPINDTDDYFGSSYNYPYPIYGNPTELCNAYCLGYYMLRHSPSSGIQTTGNMIAFRFNPQKLGRITSLMLFSQPTNLNIRGFYVFVSDTNEYCHAYMEEDIFGTGDTLRTPLMDMTGLRNLNIYIKGKAASVVAPSMKVRINWVSIDHIDGYSSQYLAQEEITVTTPTASLAELVSTSRLVKAPYCYIEVENDGSDDLEIHGSAYGGI